jgi:hypothetical protein
MILVTVAATVSGCAGGTAKQPTAAGPAAQAAPQALVATFGEPSPAASSAPLVPVEELQANIARYDGKPLRVTGKVSEVCAKKGCWLTLGGTGEPLFVKFTCPVGDRLIPAGAVGKEAVVEGTVKVVQISERQARHFKEDAGAPAEEIAKIVGPQKQYIVASPSARITGLAQPPAPAE